MIEAVATSPLMRFRDDVLIRLTRTSEVETRIDIRSASRLGKHDLGANARRVLALIEAIARLSRAE